MTREHRIRITWSPEYERIGLPQFARSIDPVNLPAPVPAAVDGWSLAYRFDRTPREQGNPSDGWGQFCMETAPEEWLVPGAKLQLLERTTRKYALLEVLD